MLQILVSSERLRLGFRKCAAAAAAFDGPLQTNVSYAATAQGSSSVAL